jgi:hypothetical protein
MRRGARIAIVVALVVLAVVAVGSLVVFLFFDVGSGASGP